MYKLFLILVFLCLISCSTPMPKEVDIAVPVNQTKVSIPKKPYLPIADLTKESKPDVVMKSYVVSVKLLQNYSNQLIEILNSMNE